jgi:hypothetical protein
VYDGQILVVLVLFSFYGVSESGGRGLVVMPPAFMAVSMVVSTQWVVLGGCSTILVISPLTVVLLEPIFLSSKLRDNDGASIATGRGSNSKDNKVELSYSTLSLLPTAIAMPPLDGTLAPLAVTGCTATSAGGFGSVALFVVALAGVLHSKRLHFEAPAVATAVSFAAAGLTVAGLLGLVAAAIPPFILHLVLSEVPWLLILCLVCGCVCYVRFVRFTVAWRNDFANWQCGERCNHLEKFCFLQVLCCTKESINVWVDYTAVIAFFQKLI